MPIGGNIKGSNWMSAESKALKSNMATALANNLNWGRVANSADVPLKTTDVIETLIHVGDYDAFASTAPNVPDANSWYISCIGGGYSATGARYLAFRATGFIKFGYIATEGTIIWKTITLT